MSEEYPHLTFLSDNRIDVEKLPRLLQKRIHGFEELQEDLPHTTEEDRPDLVHRLNALSLEIEEDLEEFYEDRLEPDPDQEEEEEEPQAEEIPVVAEPEPVVDMPVSEPEPLAPPAEQPEVLPEPSSEVVLTDAQIIMSLWKEGYRQLLPGIAAAKGLKTPLTARRIFIGNFCLQRRKYSSFYDISLTGE